MRIVLFVSIDVHKSFCQIAVRTSSAKGRNTAVRLLGSRIGV
ncbi:MAG: hypothetical protein ACETWM_00505 [Candidatus Lokiarchaeia archaeon]